MVLAEVFNTIRYTTSTTGIRLDEPLSVNRLVRSYVRCVGSSGKNGAEFLQELINFRDHFNQAWAGAI